MSRKRKHHLGYIPASEYGPIVGRAMRNRNDWRGSEKLCRDVVRSVEWYFQNQEYEEQLPRKMYRRAKRIG